MSFHIWTHFDYVQANVRITYVVQMLQTFYVISHKERYHPLLYKIL